jgi:hypothetical protein
VGAAANREVAGSNPGAFGQAVRNMALPSGVTRNNNGGISPSNMGDCN